MQNNQQAMKFSSMPSDHQKIVAGNSGGSKPGSIISGGALSGLNLDNNSLGSGD